MTDTLMMDLLFLNHVIHLLLHYHLILQILLLLYFLITMTQILVPLPHIKKAFQPDGNHLLVIHLMKKIVLKHLLYETEIHYYIYMA